MATANMTQMQTSTPITARSALPGRGKPIETVSSRIVTVAVPARAPTSNYRAAYPALGCQILRTFLRGLLPKGPIEIGKGGRTDTVAARDRTGSLRKAP